MICPMLVRRPASTQNPGLPLLQIPLVRPSLRSAIFPYSAIPLLRGAACELREYTAEPVEFPVHAGDGVLKPVGGDATSIQLYWTDDDKQK